MSICQNNYEVCYPFELLPAVDHYDLCLTVPSNDTEILGCIPAVADCGSDVYWHRPAVQRCCSLLHQIETILPHIENLCGYLRIASIEFVLIAIMPPSISETCCSLQDETFIDCESYAVRATTNELQIELTDRVCSLRLSIVQLLR